MDAAKNVISMKIPFNKPYMTGRETEYIRQAVESGHISGNGEFTKKCQAFFEERYGFRKCLLTTSCTDALEMAAILTGVGPGDEVIVPSYTFVSSALAFVRQGATIVFCDSCKDNPNIDPAEIEKLITPKTKVIVPVHYAGVACDMDAIMDIAKRYGLLVVEDAAQAIDSWHESKSGVEVEQGNVAASTVRLESSTSSSRRSLGSIGHLAAFSFHETKNIISGEGGMLAINDERFIRRAEIIWEKGTNRAEFFRGEVNKYGWVDTGSSFLPSEIVAAFLWAQLENIDRIQDRRKAIWNAYFTALQDMSAEGLFGLPQLPEFATNNAHMFYLVFPDLAKRSDFIARMKANGVTCPFHYLALHSSEFFKSYAASHAPSARADDFQNCNRYADCLVRLPMYYELDPESVIDSVRDALG